MKHLLVVINFQVADTENNLPLMFGEIDQILKSLVQENIPGIREICAEDSHIVAEVEFTPYYAETVNRNSATRVLTRLIGACERAARPLRSSRAVSFTLTASQIDSL